MVSPFSIISISKKDKRKSICTKAQTPKKMTIIPSVDESATKSAFRRKLPQVCQFYGKFPSCLSNRLSHYLLAVIISYFSLIVNYLQHLLVISNADEKLISHRLFSLLTAYQFLRCSDSVSSINLPPNLKAYAKIASSARLAYSLQQS